MLLMVSCFLYFVAELPGLSRQAFLSGGEPGFAELASASFIGAVLLAPLILYALAALSQIVLRAITGGGTWLAARVALFWALMVSAPLALFRGLVEGFIGPGPTLDVVSLVLAGVFLALWFVNLRVAAREAG